MDWNHIIKHSEQMESIITTEKRSHDWIAYTTGNRGQRAAGSTESEAIGELWRTWFEEIAKTIKEKL